MTLDGRLTRIDRYRSAATRLPAPAEPQPLHTASDVLALVERAVAEAEMDTAAAPIERARVLGYLAGVALKALEARDLAVRVEALERVLRQRRAGR
jgi:hypothetical protein